MKEMYLAMVALLTALFFSTPRAQAQVGGSGTPGSIPVWQTSTTLSNSNLVQLASGAVSATCDGFGAPVCIGAINNGLDTAVKGHNRDTGIGVHGESAGTGTGVFGNSNGGPGVQGQSQSATGVIGVSNSGRGVEGTSQIASGVSGTSDSGRGVEGTSQSASGVVGTSNSGRGVEGTSQSASGVSGTSDSGRGVEGTSNSGRGVEGTSQDAGGVVGFSTTSVGVAGNSTTGRGVQGVSSSVGGVVGISDTGVGVAGVSNGDAAVFGLAANGNDRAGLFSGSVGIQGDLLVAGLKLFRIDHPLDPANKYLSHSVIESPDAMNMYNGNITTDAGGTATVVLPDYFGALNRDFRYHLTPIGQFAQVMVASEISDNRFTIRTDKPYVDVSWQVTGVRQDAWAKAHPLQVEEDKPQAERGTYLIPELFDQPEEKGLAWKKRPDLMRDLKAIREKRTARGQKF